MILSANRHFHSNAMILLTATSERNLNRSSVYKIQIANLPVIDGALLECCVSFFNKFETIL